MDKDLTRRPKFTEFLEENKREKGFMTLGLARISWNDTKHTVNKVKKVKLDYIIIKNFCESKDKIDRAKRQPIE